MITLSAKPHGDSDRDIHSPEQSPRIGTIIKSINYDGGKPSSSSVTAKEEPTTFTSTFQLQQTSTESILENISDGVVIFDNDQRIIFFNRAAEEITGIARIKAIGQPCWKLFHCNKYEKGCATQKTFATNTPIRYTYATILNSSGDQIPVKISTILLRNQHNEVIGCAETLQDLRGLEKKPVKAVSSSLVHITSFDINMAVQATETESILSALKRNNYNRKAAAQDLGLHKSTFFRKIKQLGITLPKVDGRSRLPVGSNSR